MTVQSHSWEHTLLSLAHEAYHQNSLHSASSFDQELLNRAYSRCDEITALHSRSFSLASGLLPAPKRRAARALYAFCRISDDIVDCSESPEEAAEALERWRQSVFRQTPIADDLVTVAWADARHNYEIPQRYAEQLIDGVARDLQSVRYQNFEELAAYCYGVASTVGLMSMHIVGYSGREAIPHAIKLGVALQITNILRDVAADWQSGRVYLPQDELEEFGLGEESLAAGKVTNAWRDFMRFQIERNRQLYEEALPAISLLERDGRFAIGAAAELYRRILDDIEAHDYDVFSRRSHVTTWGKLTMLPGIWWRSRTIKLDHSPQ